jgi:hypothetical protein
MFLFKSGPKKSLYERAMENKKTAPKRIAKVLIREMDKEIEDSIQKGFQAAHIYPYRYGLAVSDDVLEIMKRYYEEQGLKDVECDKRSNIESDRYKSFNVRWWDE